MRRIGGRLADYPQLVSVLILVVVMAHFLLSLRFPALNVPAHLANTMASDPRSLLTSLSLGVAGVSAMVGGFAGVVVVFGLGTENDRFRLLRRSGGRRLRASWISVVLSSFTGAFGAVLAAVIVVAFAGEPAMWLLEACVLFAAHGAIRLTALLAGLAGIVDQEDQDSENKRREAQTDEWIPDKGSGSAK